jgi:hypothetical protein
MAKFEWEFIYIEKENYLHINLNGGLNSGFPIDSPNYYKNLSEIMKEIMFYDHVVGNKTNVLGLDQIGIANMKHEEQELEKKGTKL